MNWTLNTKISVLFLALGACFAVGGYAALKATILPTFLEFEEEAASQNRERIAALLDQTLDDVRIMNLEYSVWDQTYDYVLGRRPQFAEENLEPSYWHAVDIHLMMIFDADGERLSAMFGHPVDNSSVDIDWALDEPLTVDHPLVRHSDPGHSITGIIKTRLGPMLVASFPILTSDGSGPVVGSLITGQILTHDKVAEIGEQASTVVHFYSTDLTRAEPRVARAVGRLIESGNHALVEVHDGAIYSYELLQDIFGQPAGVLEIVSPREISQIGVATVRAAGWSLAAASAVFLLAALRFMNGLIIGPIRRLTDTILSIQETGDLSVEIGHKSNDEVGVLAREFNILTDRLDNARGDLEAARDEALESVRAKSEFLARMSHEIRTPMNGVLGMTELLRDTPLNLKQQRFAQTIYDSAESLLTIINDILDFSKMEAHSIRLEEVDVDMQTLIEETLDGVATSASARNIELVNQARLDLDCAVKSDPVRLRQVLTNLLANGIKFTHEGEVVLIANTGEHSVDRVSIHFEVRDTGIGIKPESQQEIFSAFTQEDGSTTRLYGGTGLGLAISRQLVEMMGGTLTVDSTPGEGSSFSFTLSLRKGEAIDSKPGGHHQHIAGSRALIVDDNATNREILEHQLNGWRASTDSAVSADDALEKLEAAVASGEIYDFAILDVHMPEKDGIQLAEAIRLNPALKELRLVVLSSVAESVSDKKMSELCISNQLTKPVRQAHLYDALVDMLNGSGSASVARPLRRAKQMMSGRILLAEDNPVNRMVAANILENLGLEVVVAENGEEALQKLENESIDLVLMDCQMPKMDGFEATRAIRGHESANGRRVPIVALTANALEGDREKCLESGMDEYMSKPFTSEEIQEVLSLFLDSSSGSAPSTHRGDPVLAKPQPSVDQQALDRRVIDGLIDMQQPGDDSFFTSVIETYLQSAIEAKGRLSEAIAANDAGRVVEIAHALKSSSANLGAMNLANMCKRIERMAREENLAAIAEAHEHFVCEIERVFSALRLEMESAAA